MKNNKIPGDLVITLKRNGQFEDYKITVKANDDWTQEIYSALFVQTQSGDLVPSNKKPYVIKTRLSDEKLKLLISEFERIQFFKFGKDFPQEDSETLFSISDQATETISIQLNGQEKEVSNYLGNSGKRTALLRELAERIRGVRVWNFESGKIPDDLSISYKTVYGGGAGWRDLTIKADGRIYEKSYSNLPSNSNLENLLQSLDKPKKSELKDKLSKEQIKELISEFEKINFSAFTYKVLNHLDGCSNEVVTNHITTKHISIHINNKNMYASVYENCNAKTGTDAAKFEYIFAKIGEMLKNVKITRTK
ncbi:MAG: hypothetical protein ACR2MG_19885 [Pyrinomonadaceae bacterium]